jgi:chlorite dismutase
LPPLRVAFAGGSRGEWRVTSISPVRGEPLPAVDRLDVLEDTEPQTATWVLRGLTSNERYTTRAEHEQLVARQEPLGRPEATQAALIPIRKSEEWWSLSQDQRRAVFEESSHHISIGLEYLPAVARRLHHGRDLGEPFDFLTWFEFAPEHSAAFEDLVVRLRATEEWRYVEREVDIRLSRISLAAPSPAGLASS